MPEPIFLTTDTGLKIRIISPFDYDKMEAVIDKPYLKTIFRMAMFTGLRNVEIGRLHSNPGWVMKERKLIHLDRFAQRKAKRVAPERYVPIVPQIEGELSYFFTNPKPPTLQTWNENLKRWADKAGLGIEGISHKMTRASLECWMLAAGLTESEVCKRQGHNLLTSFNHYQIAISAFTTEEKWEIIKRLAGWK